MPGPSATTRFAHDFSRIPVHFKAPVGLQAKLTVNTPGDIYEQEADRIAEQVTSMTEPQVERTCACGGCAACGNKQAVYGHLQTKRVHTNDTGEIAAPPIVHEVLRSSGQPLDPTTRGFMESRFDHDFSQVQVHTDARAVESADALRAQAYTVGQHIAFGVAQYRPHTAEGRRLLAHELVHVVQQEGRLAGAPSLGALQKKADESETCGGERTCAASPCVDPDPGREGDGGAATSWALKVMIDIEAPSAKDISGTNVGHTYVEFNDSTQRAYTYGFYPKGKALPMSEGCMVHPDTVHKSCVDYEENFELTEKEFNAALSYAQAWCTTPPPYNVLTLNCTTFAAAVAKHAGHSLPSSRGGVGPWVLGVSADSPNKLHDELKRRDTFPTYNLMGDTEIRDAINKADEAMIAKIPSPEKYRIVNRLLEGWLSDDDIAVIEKIYQNTPMEQRPLLENLIRKWLPSLASPPQNARLKKLLEEG
jgi:Domain of unknown function (DUF4157)